MKWIRWRMSKSRSKVEVEVDVEVLVTVSTLYPSKVCATTLAFEAIVSHRADVMDQESKLGGGRPHIPPRSRIGFHGQVYAGGVHTVDIDARASVGVVRIARERLRFRYSFIGDT